MIRNRYHGRGVGMLLGVSMLTLVATFAMARPAHAEIQNCDPKPTGVTEFDIEDHWIRLQIPIPGVTTTCYEPSTEGTGGLKTVYYIEDVASYIAGLYKFIAGAIGIIATMMVFYAGIRWLTAAGNRSRVQDAKETLFSALAAVVLALGSYILLYTINPRLVNLRVPTLKPVIGQLQRTDVCTETKVCLSGDRIGVSCNVDNDCGAGSQSGTCGFQVNLGGDAQPACGKMYEYTDAGAGVASCRGNYCSDPKQACALGYKTDINGDPLPVGSDVPGPFVSDPVNGTSYGCVDQILACEQISDTVDGVGAGRHDSLCAAKSVADAGKCGWYAAGGLIDCDDGAVADYCKWWPVLTCPDDYPVRVGGEVCRREAEPDGGGYINFGTKKHISVQFTGVTGSCYDSTAAEVVYDGTLASTGKVITSQCEWENEKKLFQSLKVRGICCMKSTASAATATADDLKCHVTE